MERLALMPKYDDYVDSGVEWLGRVPASWELTRLGTRFNERRSKVSDIDYPALSVTKKGVLPQLDNAAKTKDGDNKKKSENCWIRNNIGYRIAFTNDICDNM